MKKDNGYVHHRAKTNPKKLTGQCSRFPGKARYKDHEHAIEVLHRLQNVGKWQIETYGSTNRQERRAFPCKFCRGWHLSHEEKRNQSEFGKAA